ncbi:MAG: hypothetical protein ACREP6_11785, partial [Candidatus Binataceae bacterium]
FVPRSRPGVSLKGEIFVWKPASGLCGVGLLLAAALMLAGCAASQPSVVPGGNTAPDIQTVQYYPYQVKGYQKSYPARRIMILMPADSHRAPNTAGISAAPYGGDIAVGASENSSGQVSEELYSSPLAPIVRQAIEKSAGEAGLVASVSPETVYNPAKYLKQDYVLQSKVVRCWVSKKSGPGGNAGPAWFTAADFALEVTIYKPPFRVPFFKGLSAATYDDPPIDNPSATPDDETAIYDQPGEVLSVAMTRAVAGIFNRAALHSLIIEDQSPPRH